MSKSNGGPGKGGKRKAASQPLQQKNEAFADDNNRNKYKCGLCGQPKKGHSCIAQKQAAEQFWSGYPSEYTAPFSGAGGGVASGNRQTLVRKLKDKLERRIHGGEYSGSPYGGGGGGAFPPPQQPPSGMPGPMGPYSGSGMMDPMTYSHMTPRGGYGAPEANMIAVQSMVQDPASTGPFPPAPPWSGGPYPPSPGMPMWGQYPPFPMNPMSSPRGMYPGTPGPMSGPLSGFPPAPPGSFGWGGPPPVTSPRGKKRKVEGPATAQRSGSSGGKGGKGQAGAKPQTPRGEKKKK